MQLAKLVSAGAAVLVSACGAPEGGTTPEPSPEDRAAIDEQARQVQQALGDPTCGATAADVTWSDAWSGSRGVSSPDGSYDHSTCRNSYILEATMVKAGTTFAATPANPLPASNPFACLFTFAYIGLWQKQGTGYVKVTETFNFGQAKVLTNIGGFCIATPTVKAPADGDYKLVASAGTFFVGYGAVTIGAS